MISSTYKKQCSVLQSFYRKQWKKTPEGKPLFTFCYLILEFEPIAKTNSLILSIYLDEVVTTKAHMFSYKMLL